MNGLVKFLIGAITTALLALTMHSSVGLGATFIDDLESQAMTALGNAGGVGISLSLVRTPALQRVAVLCGDANPATRARLIAAVRAVPGLHDARWSGRSASTEQGQQP